MQNIVESVFALYLPSYSIVSFSSFMDMVEDKAFYHGGHFGPYNAFPNGGMEIFCLSEYDLFDLFNMDCKV